MLRYLRVVADTSKVSLKSFLCTFKPIIYDHLNLHCKCRILTRNMCHCLKYVVQKHICKLYHRENLLKICWIYYDRFANIGLNNSNQQYKIWSSELILFQWIITFAFTWKCFENIFCKTCQAPKNHTKYRKL